MLRAYVRLALFIAGLVAAVVLFTFAFTAAAVVVIAGLVILTLIGRPAHVVWFNTERDDAAHDHPLIIDHDPNDLPIDHDSNDVRRH